MSVRVPARVCVDLLIAVTIGLLLGVVLGVILLAFVISCHKRYTHVHARTHLFTIRVNVVCEIKCRFPVKTGSNLSAFRRTVWLNKGGRSV